MNPLRLRLEGFRSFAELDLQLPAGCVAVNGANGAGKSTILDALDVALFGPEGRSFEPYLKVGAPRMLLEVELEHDGLAYRVRRTYNGKRATLDVETFEYAEHAGAWHPLTEGTAADTQAMLERALGLTRDTFRASAMLRQGDGGAFTEAAPKDRKQLLADALGLDGWARAAELVRGDVRANERAADGFQARRQALAETLESLGDVDEQLAAAQATRDRLAEAIVADEGRLEAARAELETHTADELNRARLAAELSTLRRTHEQRANERDNVVRQRERLAEHRQRVTELEAEAVTATELAERVSATQTAVVEYDRARSSREALARQGDELRPRVAELDEQRAQLTEREAPTCVTCGQPLEGEARAKALDTLNAEATRIAQRLDELRARHDAIVLPEAPDRAELDALVASLAPYRDVHARLELVRRTVGELEAFEAVDVDELDRLAAEAAAECVALETRIAELGEPAVAAADAARELVAALERQLAGDRVLHTQAVNDAGRLEAAAEQAQAQRAELDAVIVEHGRVTARLADLERLLAAFWRNGVPAWIVEHHALPAIEDEANRVLSVLGGPVERVELRTQRELKSGETADALDISCVTADGERDYATFSGGERTRVNLALRIGLARLLAARRGADVRLLAIDEPDGLDEQGMAALVDVLRGLVNAGVFDTALLASHVPALRDAFDRAIAVERNGSGSRAVVT